jgi:hypothetical protein
MSLAAPLPPRRAWRPASSGKVSKIPTVDGPSLIAYHVIVAGSPLFPVFSTADLIGEGLSNEEIAARLHVAIHTVKSHVHNVLEKLALHTRLEVAAFTRSGGQKPPAPYAPLPRRGPSRAPFELAPSPFNRIDGAPGIPDRKRRDIARSRTGNTLDFGRLALRGKACGLVPPRWISGSSASTGEGWRPPCGAQGRYSTARSRFAALVHAVKRVL